MTLEPVRDRKELVPARPVRVLRNVREAGKQGALKLATVRRPERPVRSTLRLAGYGFIGLSRGIGRWWRWVTVAEYADSNAANPMLIELTRQRRRRATYWAGGITATGAVAAWVWWWPAPILALGVVVAAASIVEQLKTRSEEEGERASRALGTNPGGKAVRRAVSQAKLGKLDDIRIIAPGVVREPGAWSAMVELPPGRPAREASRKLPELAAACGVDVCQVAVDMVSGNAARFVLWVADSDPLGGPAVASPLLARTTPFDVWADKIPVGLDVRGRPVAFGLPERSLLVGGEPGGGKSVASNNVLGAVALDPHARLRLVDGKGGADLSDYEEIAEQFIGEPDPESVLVMLNDTREEMGERYRKLKAVGARKVSAELSAELDMRLIVVHLDEIQVFTTDEDLGKQIVRALWDLVSRGRASGIVVSAATQRPAAEVVPSKLRDILSVRWALRCTTPQASDTILGQGWAGRGFNAAMIDSLQRGAGLLLAEGSVPVHVKSNFISDDDLRLIGRRAYKLREAAGTLPMSDARPGVRLLKAVVEAFGDADRMWTADLLVEMAAHPTYADWDAARLADELRPFGVTPGQVNIGPRNRNGYLKGDVLRALERA